MKKFLIAGALALAMSACTSTGTGTPEPNSVTISLSAQRMLLYAETAKLGADKAAEAAVDNGLLKPGSPDAIRIADALQAAQNALVLARAAEAIGKQETVQAQLALATTLISTALTLIPRVDEGPEMEVH